MPYIINIARFKFSQYYKSTTYQRNALLTLLSSKKYPQSHLMPLTFPFTYLNK